MSDNTAEIVYEEKVKVPGRVWLMTSLLFVILGAFVYNQAVVTKQFNFVTLGLLTLVFMSQINHLANFKNTKYQLTIKDLNFWHGKKLVQSVPIVKIAELKLGTFRELIKEDAFKENITNNHVAAIPKLGGHKEVTLLLYCIDGINKAIFFYPSSQLRMALSNIVERLQKGERRDH